MADHDDVVDDPLERARQVPAGADALAMYESWAERYEDDVFTKMGVTGSTRIAELLAEHVADRTTPLLDLGCGTGAVGVHLAALGFSSVTGIDFSPAMLRVAGQRRVYRQLIEADLTDLPVLPDRFGASVSAGTFTTGHVTGASVAGLLDLHTPGATIAWTVAPTLWPGVEAALRAARVDIVRTTLESIRSAGDDRAHMIVGVVPSA